ncbi:bacteriorhodopsin [Amnibacterium endophyticum]|uniref:Bacteriorhodopsin n=1 Tax=Amnibacterium endophyticum TaxID=2109337 RepID=A0ABW4LHR6_9MICO
MTVLPRATPFDVAPWEIPLTPGQHVLIQFGIVVAAFALAAMALRMHAARREVGDRYRPAVHAAAAAVSVAFLSYALLFLELRSGYRFEDGMWRPGAEAAGTWAARFMDWTVSVPLLVIELIAVSALAGAAARRARAVGIAAGAGMAILGFLGAVVVGGGRSYPALLGFGLASAVCFVVLYAVIIATVLKSLPVLPAAARGPLTAAMVVLVVSWFAYPVVFGLQGLVSSGAVTTFSQVLLSATDLVAKVGFGLLVLRVARIRTAADVLAGEDVHPEGIWIDQLRQSDGVLPDGPPGALSRD